METKGIILENERFKVAVCDPSDRADPHFSTRYSHCGYITGIFDKASGRQLLCAPKAVFDPFSGEGFPDEFEMPVGYAEAKEGESFLKIGVGRQIKGREREYTNRDKHRILCAAPVKVINDGLSAVFRQSDTLGENSYFYQKEIRLDGGIVTISHSLKNCGNKVLETLWYSHAFLPFVEAGKAPRIEIPSSMKLCSGEQYIVREEGADGMFSTYGIEECEQTKRGVCYVWSAENAERAANSQTIFRGERAVYRAVGDYPIGLLQVFVNDRVISAEPKFRIRLTHGEVCEWSTKYHFN